MLVKLAKLAFSVCAGIAAVFAMTTFGPGLWSYLFLGIAGLVMLSIFFEKLNSFSVWTARISGVLAAIALILLLLAATVGGSFHLSESNKTFGWLLFGLSMMGLSSFKWPIQKKG